jgi:hypothetical protein
MEFKKIFEITVKINTRIFGSPLLKIIFFNCFFFVGMLFDRKLKTVNFFGDVDLCRKINQNGSQQNIDFSCKSLANDPGFEAVTKNVLSYGMY